MGTRPSMVEEWNQKRKRLNPELRIDPGDRIVAINGATDCDRIAEKIASSPRMTIKVEKDEPHLFAPRLKLPSVTDRSTGKISRPRANSCVSELSTCTTSNCSGKSSSRPSSRADSRRSSLVSGSPRSLSATTRASSCQSRQARNEQANSDSTGRSSDITAMSHAPGKRPHQAAHVFHVNLLVHSHGMRKAIY